jgi:hypothetical protein
MNSLKMVVTAVPAVVAGAAFAGSTVPLGTPLGVVGLGGTVLGLALPVVGGGLFVVAAGCLALAIYVVRRKQKS